MPVLKSISTRTGLLVLAAALGLALLVAGSARADTPAYGVGPSGPYAYGSDDCSGGLSDPIGVIFKGKRGGPSNVSAKIRAYTGWGYDENGGAQGVKVKQKDGTYKCRSTDRSRAEAPEYVPASRYHVRLWGVPATYETSVIKTVGTPHHEDWKTVSPQNPDCTGKTGLGNHAVDQNGKDGSGFDKGRHQLKWKFEDYGYNPEVEEWGNSEVFKQCDDGWAGSDGWGITIVINNALSARTLSAKPRATTSGLSGAIDTEEATTDYWFAYGTSPSKGSGYPNKTAVKSTSANGEISISDSIGGLAPNTVYYVRMFARNQDNEVEEGNEIQYSTLPTSNVTVSAHPTNGAPGSSWASGTVTSGGNPVNGEWLNVNFSKKEGGEWVLKETLHPVVSGGTYSTGSFATGVGKWRVKAVLPGSETVEGAESGYDEYEIEPGLCKTETFITPGAPVQGQPGFISVNGTVAVPNSAECGNVNGQYVNVNFSKKEGGVYVYKNTAQPTVVNGTYSVANWGVGTGEWKVKTVFPTQNWFKESESGEHTFSIVANGWHIDNLGGTFTADPDISSQGSGKLDVFGRGAENGLWIKSYPVSGGWGSWVSMGGVLAGGPGAVSWSNNRIDVVASDTGGNVAHWYWAPGWGFDYLGNGITADPDISSWGPNRLDVFARASNGNLLHKYWAGAGWSGWENMGGNIVGGPSAVSWGVNRIDVVARMTDNTIGHWWWGGAGWNYDNLGGTLTSDPSISSQGSGKLDVFARGAEMGLWHRWYTTSYGNWSNWEPRGGYLTSGPGSVSWGNGRVDVVARAANNSLEHWWFQ